MAIKDFKVRKGLHVGDSATIMNNLNVGGHSVLTGNLTIGGSTSITGGISGRYAGFDSDFGQKATGDLTEHTNLFYTTGRADSAINAFVDSAFLATRLPEYVTDNDAHTLTNKTIVDPIIDSTPMFGQPFGGISFNVDGNIADSTQALMTFVSRDSLDAAGLVLGVKNHQRHVIGTRGNSASNKLVIGKWSSNSIKTHNCLSTCQTCFG